MYNIYCVTALNIKNVAFGRTWKPHSQSATITICNILLQTVAFWNNISTTYMFHDNIYWKLVGLSRNHFPRHVPVARPKVRRWLLGPGRGFAPLTFFTCVLAAAVKTPNRGEQDFSQDLTLTLAPTTKRGIQPVGFVSAASVSPSCRATRISSQYHHSEATERFFLLRGHSFLPTMNLRFLLHITTLFVFLVLTLQTCLALPIGVFCLMAGIVVFGALAYLASSELWVLLLLETQGKTVPATVVDVRQNRVGWQRLQVKMLVPDGTLQKWTDETSRTTATCKHAYNIGDRVTVLLSQDWRHCRLVEPSSSLCQVGTVMTILTLGAVVATGKMLLLIFLLVMRKACVDTCDTDRCQDEFWNTHAFRVFGGSFRVCRSLFCRQTTILG